MDPNDSLRAALRPRLRPVPAPPALRFRISVMLALEEVLAPGCGEPPRHPPR